MMRAHWGPLGLVLLLVAASTPLSGADGSGHTTEEVWIESFDGLLLDATLFRPAGASASAQVPMVLHSHGWGGAKATEGFDAWLDAGFGVLSFSQRGHGETGGTSMVMDPDFEGQDVKAVVDFVAGLDWVLLDGPGDPVLGALGGSYGGGYQYVGALTEVRDDGATRFDALSPEITWYDLPDSLAPNDVVRTAYVTGLYATGAAADMLPPEVHEAYWYAMVTGQLPDGSVPGTTDIVSRLRANGPVGFVEDLGLRLDVPVLAKQGMTDTLFNFNQAVRNHYRTLTDDARSQSYLFGFNGGHQQLYPAFQFPPGGGGAGDPCGDALGGWETLQIAFYENHLKGAANALPLEPFHVATTGDACVGAASLHGAETVTLGPVATNTGAGVPQYVAVAQGPMTVAGVPRIAASATAAPVDQRVFFGLAVGSSPADAKVLGKAFMPARFDAVGLGATLDMELAGVATTLAAGETLYLVVAPFVDQFGAHGSRVPGAVVLDGIAVTLPVVP